MDSLSTSWPTDSVGSRSYPNPDILKKQRPKLQEFRSKFNHDLLPGGGTKTTKVTQPPDLLPGGGSNQSYQSYTTSILTFCLEVEPKLPKLHNLLTFCLTVLEVVQRWNQSYQSYYTQPPDLLPGGGTKVTKVTQPPDLPPWRWNQSYQSYTTS